MEQIKRFGIALIVIMSSTMTSAVASTSSISNVIGDSQARDEQSTCDSMYNRCLAGQVQACTYYQTYCAVEDSNESFDRHLKQLQSSEK